MSFDFSTDDLELVASLDDEKCIGLDTIRNVLQKAAEQTLEHGKDFTGRPVTKIVASDDYVIKWRSEYRFSEKDTRRWIERTLAQEREYHVHNPAKTWFYARTESQCLIASITPKMMPLHTAESSLGGEAVIDHMIAMAHMYFRVAVELGGRLDEGLSNFGIDSSGTLYYIDDDIYRWDKFNALTQTLGVWFRQLTWLPPELAKRLGIGYRESLMEYFKDAHWLTVIVRQLNSLFYANDEQKNRKQGFIDGFERRKSSIRVRNRGISDNKFAILADVHGNYAALQAVLSQLDQWGIREGIVLGDIVGYGPEPVACIKYLNERNFIVIKGNHDHGLVTGNLVRGFSSLGRWVLEWSTEQVSEQDRAWLSALPAYHQQDEWLAVHGSPQDKTFFNAYVYHMTYESNLDYMAEHKLRLCLHGHTHVQGVYYMRGKRKGFEREDSLRLDSFNHALVCPGSVGQPRSKRVGTEFAVFDRDAGEVRFHLLDYDLDRMVTDMREKGFPQQLISRLQVGQ